MNQTTADKLADLDREWNDINEQLTAAADGDAGPLLERLDELEYEIGMLQRGETE